MSALRHGASSYTMSPNPQLHKGDLGSETAKRCRFCLAPIEWEPGIISDWMHVGGAEDCLELTEPEPALRLVWSA
jgi:hypothetical protein